MSGVERSASASWRGSIVTGEGLVNAASGAFGQLPVSLQTRIGEWAGQTSPEELLAAAFGTCFVMSIAAEMTTRQLDLDDLDCFVTCTEGQVDDGFAVTGLSANVRIESAGVVPNCGRGDRRDGIEWLSHGQSRGWERSGEHFG